MGKQPSVETQLRTAKRDRKEALQLAAELRRDVGTYRARATKAEQEAAEWKARFDKLLEKIGKGALEASDD